MIVYYLLDNGADLNYSGGRLNEIPLQWAVRNEKYVTEHRRTYSYQSHFLLVNHDHELHNFVMLCY